MLVCLDDSSWSFVFLNNSPCSLPLTICAYMCLLNAGTEPEMSVGGSRRLIESGLRKHIESLGRLEEAHIVSGRLEKAHIVSGRLEKAHGVKS